MADPRAAPGGLQILRGRARREARDLFPLRSRARAHPPLTRAAVGCQDAIGVQLGTSSRRSHRSEMQAQCPATSAARGDAGAGKAGSHGTPGCTAPRKARKRPGVPRNSPPPGRSSWRPDCQPNELADWPTGRKRKGEMPRGEGPGNGAAGSRGLSEAGRKPSRPPAGKKKSLGLVREPEKREGKRRKGNRDR